MKDPILILGAMDGEITEFITVLENRQTEQWHSFEFHIGRIQGHDVVVSKSGVGKTLSACLSQRLIDRFAPSRIIFTGLAGAINPDLEIGDTLVGEDCIQHDLDATALGFARGEVPYTAYRVLPCDPRLVQLAKAVKPAAGTVRGGRVLTGDQFLVTANRASHAYLRSELEGDVVEMEGASVGLVAAVNQIPYLIIRTVSDKADGTAGIDFSAFLRRASENSCHFVTAILGNLR